MNFDKNILKKNHRCPILPNILIRAGFTVYLVYFERNNKLLNSINDSE